MISAPPTPISARAAISRSAVPDQAATNEQTPKMAKPANNVSRRPKRSPRLPIVSSNPAKTST
jgi:hypothetical protein